MTGGSIQELAVTYDADPTYQRIARARRLLRSRIIGLVISLVLLALVTFWQRERVGTGATWVVWVVVVGGALVWVAVTWWLWRRALTAVATLGEGVALRVGRRGLEVAGRSVGWPQVQGLRAVPGPLTLGPRLELRETDGRTTAVPWDQLDVRPATLDSTVRAYSGGRHGVDLNALDA